MLFHFPLLHKIFHSLMSNFNNLCHFNPKHLFKGFFLYFPNIKIIFPLSLIERQNAALGNLYFYVLFCFFSPCTKFDPPQVSIQTLQSSEYMLSRNVYFCVVWMKTFWAITRLIQCIFWTNCMMWCNWVPR